LAFEAALEVGQLAEAVLEAAGPGDRLLVVEAVLQKLDKMLLVPL
jgi:hypothetical protein